MNTYLASMYVGPTLVKTWANLARLYFAEAVVFEGTERVWIRDIKAKSIYDVERDMRCLFPSDRGFRTGLFIRLES